LRAFNTQQSEQQCWRRYALELFDGGGVGIWGPTIVVVAECFLQKKFNFYGNNDSHGDRIFQSPKAYPR
jgi:hypothetical protein